MGASLKKKVIVISAVNFFEGGPLTILKDNLVFLNECLSGDYEIKALVHRKKLFHSMKLDSIELIEFPSSRGNYLKRLYLEYFYFNKLSKKWNPYLWFSLHDITPNVKADIRAVYCHNSSAFKKVILSDLFFQPVLFFFSLFYKFLYKINIKKNHFVVVQQNWLKDEFVKVFKLTKDKTIVCYPKVNTNSTLFKESNEIFKNDYFTFFYPALARPFKNFEVIGDAVSSLEKKGLTNFQVIITINGSENKYSKYVYKKYSHLQSLHFVGMLPFSKVGEIYQTADALLFPSTLESWGLPITEFKAFNKPILLSNLPYAYEALGEYNKGCFFNPFDSSDLSEKMFSLMKGNLKFDLTAKRQEEILVGWYELYNKILNK